VSIAPNWRKGGDTVTREEYLREPPPEPTPPARGTREHGVTRSDTDWRSRTRCGAENKPNSFFYPDEHVHRSVTAQIRVFCAGCDVAWDCLQYAIDNYMVHGWWGGLSPDDRKAMRPGPRARRHGTEVMWQYGPTGTDRASGCRCVECTAGRALRRRQDLEKRRAKKAAS
jgi:hypothetical protein